MTYLEADDYRVEGETSTLKWGFAVLVALIVVASAATAGFALLAIALAGVVVWIKQGQLLGESAQVSKAQFAHLHQIVNDASGNLGMQSPPIFIEQNPSINAFALGFLGTKSVVLHSATVEAMTPKELTFIVGHEFSHIKCGHTNMGVLTNSSGALQIPLVSWLLGLIFQAWSRKAEYTCDRGGLLACRDVNSAVGALCKVSVGPTLFKQMNIDAFLQQHKLVEQNDISRASELLIAHPYLVKRIQALYAFFESPEYERLARATMQDRRSSELSIETRQQGPTTDVGVQSMPIRKSVATSKEDAGSDVTDSMSSKSLTTPVNGLGHIGAIAPKVEQVRESDVVPNSIPLNSPLYLQALKELEGALDMSVWERAFAESNGNKAEARERYARIRAVMMSHGDHTLNTVTPPTSEQAKVSSGKANPAMPTKQNSPMLLPITERIWRGLHDLEIQALQASANATFFLIACQRDPISMVRKLLNENPLLVGVRNSDGNTGLHIAFFERRIDVAKCLVGAGAPVLWENNYGVSALSVAEEKCPKEHALLAGIRIAASRQGRRITPNH